MDIQEIFIKLANYDISCRTYEGHFLISVRYDQDWAVIEPSDTRVQCKAHAGGYVYCAPIADGGLDAIFESIQETIEYNETAIKKHALFQKKVEELSKIFVDNDIEYLEHLEFVYKSPKKKTSRKSKTANKDDKPIEETVADAEEKVEENPTEADTTTVDREEEKIEDVPLRPVPSSFGEVDEDGYDPIENIQTEEKED